MGVNFIGNCNWRWIESRKRSPARDLPQTVETWIGRYDQLATFLATYPVGLGYAGGYITDHDIDDSAPQSTVGLIVTLPPPFGGYLRTPSRSIKTATKSATVTGTNLIPAHLLPEGVENPSSVQAVRTLSFYAPESRYEYFTASEPTAPSYSSAGSRNPSIISARLEVSFGGVTIAFTGATAPAAISTAVFMPIVDRVVSDGGEPIPGTPWYRCVDVVSREYQGDS